MLRPFTGQCALTDKQQYENILMYDVVLVSFVVWKWTYLIRPYVMCMHLKCESKLIQFTCESKLIQFPCESKLIKFTCESKLMQFSTAQDNYPRGYSYDMSMCNRHIWSIVCRWFVITVDIWQGWCSWRKGRTCRAFTRLMFVFANPDNINHTSVQVDILVYNCLSVIHERM